MICYIVISNKKGPRKAIPYNTVELKCNFRPLNNSQLRLRAVPYFLYGSLGDLFCCSYNTVSMAQDRVEAIENERIQPYRIATK